MEYATSETPMRRTTSDVNKSIFFIWLRGDIAVDYIIILEMKKALEHYFDLLWVMTRKEVEARYKRTVFGFLWMVINPLLQMVVVGTIFSQFVKEPINNYFHFLFVGLLVWNFFSISLTKATPSIVNERALIKKARFYRSVIPLAIVFANAFHFLVGLVIFLPVVHFFARELSWGGLAGVGIGLAQLVLLTVGITLFTSAVNVRFRDVTFFVQAMLVLWFYATPIVYPLEFISRASRGWWLLNPLTGIIEKIQFSLLGFPKPEPLFGIASLALTMMVLSVGLAVFFKESTDFDDWV